MTNFSLRILIDKDDLATIVAANECICVSKSVNASGLNKQAVWVKHLPFPSLTIQWEESYGVYASLTEIKDDNVIESGAQQRTMPDRYRIPFENQDFQTPKLDATLQANEYGIDNNEKPYPSFNFGLIQQVKSDQTEVQPNPLNIVQVPYNQQVTMQPINKVYIWLSATDKTNSVISTISSKNASEFDLTEHPSQTIKYYQGKFIPVR